MAVSRTTFQIATSRSFFTTAWSTALWFPITFLMGSIPIPFSATRPMRLLRVDPIRN